METPDTEAGRTTEQIMALIREAKVLKQDDEIANYNRTYSIVLGVLEARDKMQNAIKFPVNEAQVKMQELLKRHRRGK